MTTETHETYRLAPPAAAEPPRGDGRLIKGMALGAWAMVLAVLLGVLLRPAPRWVSLERRLEIARAHVDVLQRELDLDRQREAVDARYEEVSAEWAEIQELPPAEAKARIPAYERRLQELRALHDQASAGSEELETRIKALLQLLAEPE